MNRLLSKLKTGLINPREGLELFVRNSFGKFLPDELYIQLICRIRNGYGLNLRSPQTFTEKLNYLKLHDRNSIYHTMVDKYEAKKYVADIIGEKYVVKCHGVWNKFEEIDIDELPNKFVLKSTHDSSGVIICKDRNTFDVKAAREHFKRSLSNTNYQHLREWVYKDLKPRIIADELLDEGTGLELHDYKFWCFGGEPKVMYCTNKAQDIYENFYDMDFKPLSISHGFRRMKPEFTKPAEFELMKQLAAQLSKNIPFVRVDFFDVNGRVYFGEYTFYDWGGMKPVSDSSWEMKLGDYIKLSNLQ